MSEIPLGKQLEEMLKNRDFSKLESFRHLVTWPQLSCKERHLLGLLFAAHGEFLLFSNNSAAMESFLLAQKVAPQDPLVFYRIAQAYGCCTRNLRCLQSASQILQSLTTMEPTFYPAWIEWGIVLTHQGAMHADHAYLHEAQDKFKKAESYLSQFSWKEDTAKDNLLIDAQPGFLYWQWGNAWQETGRLSGEAHDFYRAIDKYRKAADLGFDSINFWENYAVTLMDLAFLLGNQDHLTPALEILQRAVYKEPDYQPIWFRLALCYQTFYEKTHEPEHLRQADHCFSRSAQLCLIHPNNRDVSSAEVNLSKSSLLYNARSSLEDEAQEFPLESRNYFSNYFDLDSKGVDLWMYWGKLFAYAGKLGGVIEFLEHACEKLNKANEYDPNHPNVLRSWAEVLMLRGIYREQLDLLREAEIKIIKSLELAPENIEGWRIYGTCLTELGRYFSDEAYFVQAIEKFRYGLKLNSKNPALWQSLSLTYFALGELKSDSAIFEQAVHACNKAIECCTKGEASLLNDLGVILMKLAEIKHDQVVLESAIEKFEKALEKEDEELEWLYNYGCALDFLGDFTANSQEYERAIQVLSYVVQQDPAYTHARYNFAIALSHLGELTDDPTHLERSLEHFQILLEENKEDEAGWNEWGEALLNLAVLYSDAASMDQSHSYYEQAEQKLLQAASLGSTAAYYNLACLYALTKNYTAAMHYVEKGEAAGALPPIEELLHDEWLEGLRETADFRHFIAFLSQQQGQE